MQTSSCRCVFCIQRWSMKAIQIIRSITYTSESVCALRHTEVRSGELNQKDYLLQNAGHTREGRGMQKLSWMLSVCVCVCNSYVIEDR